MARVCDVSLVSPVTVYSIVVLCVCPTSVCLLLTSRCSTKMDSIIYSSLVTIVVVSGHQCNARGKNQSLLLLAFHSYRISICIS